MEGKVGVVVVVRGENENPLVRVVTNLNEIYLNFIGHSKGCYIINKEIDKIMLAIVAVGI